MPMAPQLFGGIQFVEHVSQLADERVISRANQLSFQTTSFVTCDKHQLSQVTLSLPKRLYFGVSLISKLSYFPFL